MKRGSHLIFFLTAVMFFVTHTYAVESEKKYHVYVDDQSVASFESYKEALYFSYQYERVKILDGQDLRLLYHNHLKFNVSTVGDKTANTKKFYEYQTAVEHAKKIEGKVTTLNTNKKVWDSTHLPQNNQIELNRIKQFPELPRGCSVVSLAMLLNHTGINIDKMALMAQVHKQDKAYQSIEGQVEFADPYYGFVGEVSTFEEPGLGVYFPAIYELMLNHLGDRALNVSGTDFEDLFYLIDMNKPIWTMVNAKYQRLNEEDFLTWYVDGQPVQITKWMHAVVVTGYDDDHIYVADPLEKVSKVSRQGFIEAYNQMGKQALSYQ